MDITFKGKPVTVDWRKLIVDDKAPEFTVLDSSNKEVTLKDSEGVRVFLSVPSLETPTCDLETRTFNEKTAEIEGVTVYTFSIDPPEVLSKWCAAKGIKNVITLSDTKDKSFGLNYGVYVEELKLLTRAVFVVDETDKIVHIEFVSEITDEPNYEFTLDVVKKLLSKERMNF